MCSQLLSELGGHLVTAIDIMALEVEMKVRHSQDEHKNYDKIMINISIIGYVQ